MTLNELKTVFDTDDLNPNSEMIFEDGDGRDYVIDDVSESHDNTIFVCLRRRYDN